MKNDPNTITRTWKRFYGLNDQEAEEAESYYQTVRALDLHWISPLVAEKQGIRAGEWTSSQWFSCTTDQCCECMIAYCQRCAIVPALNTTVERQHNER